MSHRPRSRGAVPVAARRLLPAVLLAAAVLQSCATYEVRIDVAPLFAAVNGDLALQSPGGGLVLHDQQNSVGSNLGLGDVEPAPFGRVTFQHEAHRIRAHATGFSTAGEGSLAGDFGSIAAGTQVASDLDFFTSGISYTYEVLGGENWHVGLGGQLGYTILDVRTRAIAGFGADEVESYSLVPMPFAEFEARYGDFALVGQSGIMAADFGDANGRYWDIELGGRVRVSDTVDLIAGYRHLVLDVFGSASGRDFDADLDLSGVFVGGTIRFGPPPQALIF